LEQVVLEYESADEFSVFHAIARPQGAAPVRLWVRPPAASSNRGGIEAAGSASNDPFRLKIRRKGSSRVIRSSEGSGEAALGPLDLRSDEILVESLNTEPLPVDIYVVLGFVSDATSTRTPRS
jgi:hypothetical protein